MTVLKTAAPIIAASMIAGTLMSGLANINFQHNIHLPKEISAVEVVTQTSSYSIRHFPTVTVTDIRLKNELKGTDSVKSIIRVLQEAQSGDTVIFHLAGMGGDVDTLFLLVNNILMTKAHVIMSVEAPVYSAHAYLALFGNELKVAPLAFLMFHTSSGVNINCAAAQGTDRGVSNVEHCQGYQKANLTLSDSMILQAPLLTQEEKLSILFGHDVYIMSDDANQRLGT